MITVWISKYALTRGISPVGMADATPSSYGYLHPQGHYQSYKVGTDIHMTREEAIKEAEKKRNKKIASLKKQIQKLEDLRFV